MKYQDTRDPKWRYRVSALYSRQLLRCMNNAKGVGKGTNGKVYWELKNGYIYIYPGFRWNGLDYSPDFRCAMEASLVHDVLCQWIEINRKGAKIRECADQHFYCMTKKSCGYRRASMMYNAIRGFQKGWLVGGLLGAIWGFFSRPRISCS